MSRGIDSPMQVGEAKVVTVFIIQNSEFTLVMKQRDVCCLEKDRGKFGQNAKEQANNTENKDMHYQISGFLQLKNMREKAGPSERLNKGKWMLQSSAGEIC